MKLPARDYPMKNSCAASSASGWPAEPQAQPRLAGILAP